jgi:hypothetical protein
MSFSVAWIGIPEAAASDALSQLGFAETDIREWMPESEIVSLRTPTGWYVILFNDVNPSALRPEALKSLSARTHVIACRIEEHAMCSTAASWENGSERWFVAHDAEDGLDNLEVVGDPPPVLDQIRDEQAQLQRQSARVDYFFDVPLKLAHREVGFRHDDAFDEAESEQFIVLAKCGAR